MCASGYAKIRWFLMAGWISATLACRAEDDGMGPHDAASSGGIGGASGGTTGAVSQGGDAHGGSELGGRTSTSGGGSASGGRVAGTGGQLELGGSGSTATCADRPAWSAMSTEGIQWLESPTEAPPPILKSHAIDERVFVSFPMNTNAAPRLLSFDVCDNRWSEVPLDFTTQDLFAITGNYPSMFWKNDRIVYVGSDPARASAAEVSPIDGNLRAVPRGSVKATEAVWDLPTPFTSRSSARAESPRHILEWGSQFFNARATAGEERFAAINEGQVYSYETQSWKAVTLRDAPSKRFVPHVAALGERFWIWGGFAGEIEGAVDPASVLTDGAIYDPATDRFSAISSTGAPPQRTGSVLGAPQQTVVASAADVFVIDTTTGVGGVYASELDRWFPLAETNLPSVRPAAPELHLLNTGDLAWIFPDEIRVASKRGGTWASFRQGSYSDALSTGGSPAAAGLNFLVKAWTGSVFVQWGAYHSRRVGCDQPLPPPTMGCDPFLFYDHFAFGTLLGVDALRSN